jgi:beta-xylosidase
MPPGGISLLKSTNGKPEGPYVHAYADSSKPFIGGINPAFFQDDDGKVYFTWSSGTRIAVMKDDMSGFEGELHQVKLADPDHTPEHHAQKCRTRGMNDLGHEGAVLFKANGKYYLGAADDYEGRYSTCLAMSDHIFALTPCATKVYRVREAPIFLKIKKAIVGAVSSATIRNRHGAKNRVW